MVGKIPMRVRLHVEALQDRCLLSAGALDLSFGNAGTGIVSTAIGGEVWIQGMAMDSEGNVDVAGVALVSGHNYEFLLARYTSAGVLDRSFAGTGFITSPLGIYDAVAHGPAIDHSTGDIYVVGYARATHAGPNGFAIARYTPSGLLDSSFGGGTGAAIMPIGSNAIATRVAVDGTGSVYVSGYASFAGGVHNQFALVRYTSAGLLDMPRSMAERNSPWLDTRRPEC